MPVYLIRQGLTGSVKIGFATDVTKRVKQLQTNQPVKLRVVRVLDGDRGDEARLHKLFSDCRLAGEWFSFSDRMLTDDFGLADLPIPLIKRQRGQSDHDTPWFRERDFHAEVLNLIGGAEALGRRLRLPPWEVAPNFIRKRYWSAAVLMLNDMGRHDITMGMFAEFRRAVKQQNAEYKAEKKRLDDQERASWRLRDEREWIAKHGVQSAWWQLTAPPDASGEAA